MQNWKASKGRSRKRNDPNPCQTPDIALCIKVLCLNVRKYKCTWQIYLRAPFITRVVRCINKTINPKCKQNKLRPSGKWSSKGTCKTWFMQKKKCEQQQATFKYQLETYSVQTPDTFLRHYLTYCSLGWCKLPYLHPLFNNLCNWWNLPRDSHRRNCFR